MIPFYREAIKNGKAGNLRFPAGIGVMRPLCGKKHDGNWKLQGARMAFVKRARLPQAEDSAPMQVSRTLG